ncbi:NADH-quinone oxidoreductase subunit NuoG [Pseudomonas aeruginosa]|uniref:NADH-quinone oxidoreductase subunit NuoG n=1 Tax=Pseudomonas aeruginosa TaxID=287 RepID=UPI0010444CA1|nr:NADH-quinone oxidoreductase subunit NuoG [Pseudomonas aeruginosa]
MATIHVDGKTLEVDGADNLLQACLSLGLDIPYFCWHPALGSVGACRQCAVKQYTDENDKRGRLVMSCMTPATDNTWISIEDEEAKQFRASVVEWLMTNHPHDCPVCEEGGHCHLQDMTVMTGHNERRYRFTKRTHQNQELGPFIAHEMNRCIACYRCVRYYKDYAGGTDLGVYGAHDNVYFGRVEDGVLESEFSGNLTEVCPTGVFTDKTHSERYNRKWDMQFAPSICHGCSSGCNISPGERYGEIRRIENRYNGSVNHYFLCDRGRFGYGYVNREDRPRQPLLVLSKQKLSLDGALDQAAALLKERKGQSVKGKAVEMAADMKVQPWLDAAVKNIAQHAQNPLFIASVSTTRLDDVAEETVHAAPDDLARLGFAVAHAIDPSAPSVADLDPQAQAFAQRIADALLAAKRPLVVSGNSLGNKALIEAAANIAKALKQREKNGSISLVVGEANSLGLALFGGDSVEAALERLTSGQADAVVVLENDLYRRTDAARVDAALAAAKVVIVADHQQTATTAKAHLVLPAASFAEGDGTLVSQEGRAQRFFQVFDPTYYDARNMVREGWRWLHAIHSTLQGKRVDWTQLDHVTEAVAEAKPILAGIRDAAPAASFRIKGLKLAREPHRYSGRTAMRANISVHEPRTPQDIDSAFAFSMEGYSGSQEDRQQIPFAWSPGWNSPQAWNKFQDEVGGHLRAGDPGVRLIEPKGEGLDWFQAVPVPFSAKADSWKVVPLYHLFGSEENSSRAAPIQQRIPETYVALSKEDADRLGVNDGATLGFQLKGQALRLPLRIDEQLGAGLIGLPVGFAGIPAAIAGCSVEGLQEAAQ